MPDEATMVMQRGRTPQDYIDERPVWPDGTPLPSVPMTAMQWRIWTLAAAGKFFEGFVVFMTGVALPLISRDFQISPSADGFVSSATLFGILVGAVGLGGLSDRFGRKSMFIAEMIIFSAFLALLVICQNVISLIICLFGLGMALGCDYPTAHMIISESIPSLSRGKLVLGAFALQACGALAGTLVGYAVLVLVPDLTAWRWMFATALIPALIVTAYRFFITESANWLYARGRYKEAEAAAGRLLVRNPPYPGVVTLNEREVMEAAHGHGGGSFLALFRPRYIRATILASVPWFLQDLSTYGIGIFTPTILASALGSKADHIRSVSDLISNDILATKGAALVTVLLIVGIAFAVVLADKLGRIRLQIGGFIGCAVGLLLASLATDFPQFNIFLIFAGFMLFNFMTNIGPNAQTYLLAGEVFPTAIRGSGAGFAAAFAKIGAVATAFLFPILLVSIGTRWLLYGLIVSSLLGAVVTWLTQIETTGVNLDTLD
jgi:MFS transporter, putative metabolite transport protein